MYLYTKMFNRNFSGEVLKLKGQLQSLQNFRRQSISNQDKMVNQARLLTRRATVYRAKVEKYHHFQILVVISSLLFRFWKGRNRYTNLALGKDVRVGNNHYESILCIFMEYHTPLAPVIMYKITFMTNHRPKKINSNILYLWFPLKIIN